jgi:hypothetical protein
MIFVLTNTLLTVPITAKNLIFIEGNFISIVKKRIKGKVSFWYDISIKQEIEPFKISADYTNCFDLNSFINEVETGDIIKIGFTEKDGPFRNGSVALIIKGNRNYFDLECRNSNIVESKITISIISISAIFVFILLIIWLTKNNKY